MTEEQRAYWYERVTRAIDQNLPISFEDGKTPDRATLMMRRIRRREQSAAAIRIYSLPAVPAQAAARQR